jgi:hypothetical protein
MLAGESTKDKLLHLTPEKIEAVAQARNLTSDEKKRLEALTREMQSQSLLVKKTDEEELNKLLGLGAKPTAGVAANDPCGTRKKPINVELLADKVYERLLFEARIERERIGWELL